MKTSELENKNYQQILLKNRIINVVGEVTEEMATDITSMLMILANESDDPIQLFINSPGGSCIDGLAIIDVMNFIKAPVYTICTGMAASMAAVILSCGEKGHRYVLPNATVMIHQASGGSRGNVNDCRIQHEEMELVNERLMRILANNTGKTYNKILKDTDRDCYLPATKVSEKDKRTTAVDYGIADKIINSVEDFK